MADMCFDWPNQHGISGWRYACTISLWSLTLSDDGREMLMCDGHGGTAFGDGREEGGVQDLDGSILM